MAWSTSAGNRGYIFLISAMKVIYLCVTSSYCFSFIASFLTGIVQYIIWGRKFVGCVPTELTCPLDQFGSASEITTMNWVSYGIYASFIIAISIISFIAHKEKQPQNIYEYKQMPKIFFYCAVASIATAAIGLLAISISFDLQAKMIGTFQHSGPVQHSQATLQGVVINATIYN